MINQRTRTERFEIDKPEWNVGYRWEYQITTSGGAERSVQEVRGLDTSVSVPAYLLMEKNEERRYSLASLGLLETRVDGLVKTRRHKSNELLAWPLQHKKEWRNQFELESLELNRTVTVDRLMIVSGVEEVKIPAGNFRAIKIEAYDHKSGRLMSEYWYSSDVRWYVKTLRYESQGTYFTEEQLTSFRIN